MLMEQDQNQSADFQLGQIENNLKHNLESIFFIIEMHVHVCHQY